MKKEWPTTKTIKNPTFSNNKHLQNDRISTNFYPNSSCLFPKKNQLNSGAFKKVHIYEWFGFGGASTHGMVSWGLGPRPTTTCQLTIYLSPNLHQLTVYTYLSFGLYSFTCNNMYLSKCCKYLGLKKDIHITISILLFISWVTIFKISLFICFSRFIWKSPSPSSSHPCCFQRSPPIRRFVWKPGDLSSSLRVIRFCKQFGIRLQPGGRTSPDSQGYATIYMYIYI